MAFGRQPLLQHLGFSGDRRGLGELGPQLLDAALPHGLPGFHGLELLLHLGLGGALHPFEALLLGAAGCGLCGEVSVGRVVGNVIGAGPAPRFAPQAAGNGGGGFGGRTGRGGVAFLGEIFAHIVGPLCERGHGQVGFGAGQRGKLAGQLLGRAEQLKEAVGQLGRLAFHGWAGGDGRAKYDQAGDKLQVDLLQRELGAEPCGQGLLLAAAGQPGRDWPARRQAP